MKLLKWSKRFFNLKIYFLFYDNLYPYFLNSNIFPANFFFFFFIPPSTCVDKNYHGRGVTTRKEKFHRRVLVTCSFVLSFLLLLLVLFTWFFFSLSILCVYILLGTFSLHWNDSRWVPWFFFLPVCRYSILLQAIEKKNGDRNIGDILFFNKMIFTFIVILFSVFFKFFFYMGKIRERRTMISKFFYFLFGLGRILFVTQSAKYPLQRLDSLVYIRAVLLTSFHFYYFLFYPLKLSI